MTKVRHGKKLLSFVQRILCRIRQRFEKSDKTSALRQKICTKKILILRISSRPLMTLEKVRLPINKDMALFKKKLSI